MFASGEGKKKHIICEDCYWTNSYGDPSYVKVHKHCILKEVLTPEVCAKICTCPQYKLYTLDPPRHNDDIRAWAKKYKRCGMIRASEAAAIAKYNGLREVSEHREGLLGLLRSKSDGRASNGAKGEATGLAVDADIPLFLRSHAEENPYAHMHMALRVGPLFIENGFPE